MAPMTGIVSKDWAVDLTKSPTDLSGKNVLVVGGTNGLGRAIALGAAAKGATVTVVGRKLQDQDSSVKNLTFVKADLSSMKSAKEIGETICPDTVASLDVVLFTTGIVAGKQREASSEGIEMDMAVSFLSRLVILKYLVPRLSKNCRVFIMGFPGSNLKNFRLDDLNAEKSYEGMMGFVHANTVTGNEALVIDLAAQGQDVLYFGLNPGLIKTGIRDNIYSGGAKLLKPILEGMIGLFATSAASYATKMIPLLFAPDLNDHSGSLFNPKAQPIQIGKHFQDDKELAHKFIQESEKLVREKAGIEM